MKKRRLNRLRLLVWQALKNSNGRCKTWSTEGLLTDGLIGIQICKSFLNSLVRNLRKKARRLIPIYPLRCLCRYMMSFLCTEEDICHWSKINVIQLFQLSLPLTEIFTVRPFKNLKIWILKNENWAHFKFEFITSF